MASTVQGGWYSVRCLFKTYFDKDSPNDAAYEERVTLWQTASFEEAVASAEHEASEYAEDISGETSQTEYTGLAQCYWLADAPGHGAEVFSLIRDSDLSAEEYIRRFFATGTEHQRTV